MVLGLREAPGSSPEPPICCNASVPMGSFASGCVPAAVSHMHGVHDLPSGMHQWLATILENIRLALWTTVVVKCCRRRVCTQTSFPPFVDKLQGQTSRGRAARYPTDTRKTNRKAVSVLFSPGVYRACSTGDLHCAEQRATEACYQLPRHPNRAMHDGRGERTKRTQAATATKALLARGSGANCLAKKNDVQDVV